MVLYAPPVDTDGSFTVSWSHAIKNPPSRDSVFSEWAGRTYKLEYDSTPAFLNPKVIGSTPARSMKVTGLPGGQHFFRLTVSYSACQGGFLGTQDCTTQYWRNFHYVGPNATVAVR